MKRLIWIGVAALTLHGCTGIGPLGSGTLGPVGSPEIATGTDESCVTPTAATRIAQAKERVAWYACASRNKARKSYNKSVEWENRNEWRDIPLMGAAATVAGLLLFGERDAANALKPGEQDVISGIAFGSAVFTAFANHLSPETARRLLRQSARGNFCLANQSEILLSVWDDVTGRVTHVGALASSLAKLDAELATADPSLPNIADIRTVRDAGYDAIELYKKQLTSLQSADVFLGESAWDFGLDLVAQADRTQIDGAAFSRSIVEQARNTAAFERAEEKTDKPVAAALVDAGEAQVNAVGALRSKNNATTIYAAARQVVSDKSKLLNGLTNVEALILGFDGCATTALAGGDPRAVRVQRILPAS